MLVVFIHAISEEWSKSFDLVEGSMEPTPIINFIFYFGTLGGVFHFMMAAVLAFTMQRKFAAGKALLNELVIRGVIKGTILLSLHYIFRPLFSFLDGIVYYYIRDGTIHTPSPENVINLSTFAMLGWTSIMMSLLLGLLYRDGGQTKRRRNYTILISLSTVVLVVTPFVRVALVDIVSDLIAQQHYFRAGILGFLVYDDFPIFPFAAYGMLGVVLGDHLAHASGPAFTKKYLNLYAIFWILVGVIGISVMGGMDAGSLFDYDPDSLYRETFRQYTQVGFLLFLFQYGVQWYDVHKNKNLNVKIRNHHTRFLHRVSNISLTIFLFEGILMVGIHRVILLLFPGTTWNDSMALVVIFAICLVLMWFGIALLLFKYQKMGPVETVLKFLVNTLTKIIFTQTQNPKLGVVKEIEHIH